MIDRKNRKDFSFLFTNNTILKTQSFVRYVFFVHPEVKDFGSQCPEPSERLLSFSVNHLKLIICHVSKTSTTVKFDLLGISKTVAIKSVNQFLN